VAMVIDVLSVVDQWFYGEDIRVSIVGEVWNVAGWIQNIEVDVMASNNSERRKKVGVPCNASIDDHH
jgi:hypothetical protein